MIPFTFIQSLLKAANCNNPNQKSLTPIRLCTKLRLTIITPGMTIPFDRRDRRWQPSQIRGSNKLKITTENKKALISPYDERTNTGKSPNAKVTKCSNTGAPIQRTCRFDRQKKSEGSGQLMYLSGQPARCPVTSSYL